MSRVRHPTATPGRTLGTFLVAVAGAAAGLAVAGRDAAAWPGLVVAAAAGSAALAVGPRLAGAGPWVRRAAVCGVGLGFAVPVCLAGAAWVRTGMPVPVELPLLAGCRNALFGLAATAAGPRAWRRLVAASVFVVLLATVRLPPAVAVGLLATFAAAGATWLATGQGGGGPPAAAADARGGPAAAVVAVGLVVAGTLLAAAAVAGTGVGATVRGVLPSSGGAGRGSDRAAAGLGNGPDEVPGAEHARSSGFDQSRAFMNSETSGLYDAFLESAGAPLKKGTFEKLQMLRARDLHWTPTTGIEDYRGGRRFALDREPPPPPTAAAESHAAAALLYVEGTLPVHLRLAAYDAFDGSSWVASPPGWAGHDLADATRADPWFAVGGPGGRAYRVRVGTLVAAAVPLPALTGRVHMGQVVAARLLGWAAPDVLRMTRAAVPPGTVVDADCTPFDPGRYAADDWLNDLSSQRADGNAADPRFVRLARQWTDGLPKGWRQVRAVVDGLRGRCRLDAAFRAAAADPLAEFLFGSRRGPDYLFASAAAVTLRQVGYTTRVAGGFYAGPDAYDPTTKQALVTARSAHVWAEVRLPDGRWAVVEATPGYAVAGPDPPWTARTLAAVRAHAAAAAVGIAVAVAAWVGRLRVVDLGTAAALWAWPGRAWAVRVRRTVRVVEFRARCAGRGRPAAETASRWLGSPAVPGGPAVGRLAELATWAAYGPPDADPWPAADVRSACATAVRHLTATRLRSRLKTPNALGHGRTQMRTDEKGPGVCRILLRASEFACGPFPIRDRFLTLQRTFTGLGKK